LERGKEREVIVTEGGEGKKRKKKIVVLCRKQKKEGGRESPCQREKEGREPAASIFKYY